MIECVPIKDWVLKTHGAFLIYTENQWGVGEVFTAFYHTVSSHDLVDDYLSQTDIFTATKRDLVENTLKIAKEHYEGEK